VDQLRNGLAPGGAIPQEHELVGHLEQAVEAPEDERKNLLGPVGGAPVPVLEQREYDRLQHVVWVCFLISQPITPEQNLLEGPDP
jgi:hypothetical protein